MQTRKIVRRAGKGKNRREHPKIPSMKTVAVTFVF